MIPQNFKEIISHGENVGFLQTLAMLLFLFFFLGIVYYVFTRPKKHYDEEASAPLNDDITEEKKL